MTQLSRERAAIKSFITGFLTDPAHDNQSINSMTTKVFHIALTALDAEAQDPVAWRFWPEDDPTIWFIVDSVKDPAHSPGEVGSDGRRWLSIPLYTIPPAQPVEVPDVSELEKVLRFIEGLPTPTSGAAINVKRLHDFIAACRASMLAAAPGKEG